MPTKGIITLWVSYSFTGPTFRTISFPHCKKLSLFYNSDFTEVYINFKKVCYSLEELYVKSVYMSLFGWRGREVHETCKGGRKL
jgi:hypothetical protein